MREFAKISPNFWMGTMQKKLKESGPEALLVSLYLMTSPQSNMIGLYYLPVLYLAHGTGLDVEGASKGLERAAQVGFCHYDPESEIVWIPGMAHSQIGKSLKPSDKRCKGVQNAFEALPENPYLSAFFDMYKADYHLHERDGLSREKRDEIEGASEGLASKEKEQEQEQEKEKRTPHTSRAEFLLNEHDRQNCIDIVLQPAVSSRDVMQPQNFPMSAGWLPEPDFVYRATGYTEPELCDFITFWQASGKAFNQAQWEQKLIRSIANFRQTGSKNPRKNNGGFYAKAAAGCALVSTAFQQVRAARNAERIRQGLAVLGDYGDDLCQSLGIKERRSTYDAMDCEGVGMFG
ncbi:DnaT-like ssDNA-binding domain-containing protein [Rouxiella sp. T17]|uniref:DnaT-like ssDNA-binding domain-containing protein n=1 Tax=Rouxiella sp. T17 TaxID=3085684 RepID=UPI002FC6601E